jgi:uncharacterized protein (DUF697 family)
MLNAVKQARAAFSLLNSQEVVNRANRPVHIGLVSASAAGYAEMEDFFVPRDLARQERVRLMGMVHRAGDPDSPPDVDLVIYEEGIPAAKGTYTFYGNDPAATVERILDGNDDIHLALARHFAPFRKPVVDRIIQAVARENAIFAIATALPDVIPNLMELPWALGEWASDMAFLTANQVRMAFQIAAVCGKQVGLTHQKAEILSIGAGAFGWRAIARELVGKIPLGGGLIPKGAIAYAGTVVVGKVLERVHHAEMGYTHAERRGIYQQALERGRQVAAALIPGTRES